jgi:S1-C subfamily serine protease
VKRPPPHGGYSGSEVFSMRPGALAAVSLVSAAIGGVVVLALASATGQLGDGKTETVVVSAPAGSSQRAGLPAAVRSSARPLAGNGFDPVRLYASRADGVVTIYALFGEQPATGDAAQGSGFVVSTDGYVLTNSHVITTAGEAEEAGEVDAAREVYVEFRDGERVRAKVIGWDLFDDIGVLKVDPKHHALAPVPLGNSDSVAVGEPVAAIGSPFGEQTSLAVGVVSATRRSISALTSKYWITDAIQIDAPINRGNSGGPLFDARGRVIGINAQIRSDSGTAEGVGFAVPINSAKRSLEQLIRSGRVSYAYVGISTDDLTPALARRIGVAAQRGALVTHVSDGPGRSAGLRAGTELLELNGREVQVGGDVVVAIGDQPVRSGDDLVRIIGGDLLPGQVVNFSIVRGQRRLSLPVRLVERPVVPPEDE